MEAVLSDTSTVPNILPRGDVLVGLIDGLRQALQRTQCDLRASKIYASKKDNETLRLRRRLRIAEKENENLRDLLCLLAGEGEKDELGNRFEDV